MNIENEPMVTVILPVLNESEYIEQCLRSLMNNTYDRQKVEILVVDGGSNDGAREIVAKLASEDRRVRLIDNPGRSQAAGLNIGIKNARGDVLIRMDGHAEAEKDFIEMNIEVLNEHSDAWCVGGTMTTVHNTYIGKVIAAAMSCPAGVGSATFRLGEYEGYTDRVIFGAQRKELFEKIGLLDENLPRTEDDDFFFRLHQAGGKVYSSKRIRTKYYPRDNLLNVWRQYFQYGYWRIPTLIKHGRPGAVRQLVPMLFILGWIVLILAGLFWLPAWYALAVYAGLYIAGLLAGAALSIKKHGFMVGVATPIVFPILHFSYGLGNLAGIWRFIIRRGKVANQVSKTKITR